jgi:hypothetical protein
LTDTAFNIPEKPLSGMKDALMILLFVFAAASQINAQVLKGRITNQAGDPVPYATVYIRELKQGTTSNTKGDYEFRLPAGKYTVMYQSLGFEPMIFNITLTDKPITKDVILPVQYYQIPEVRISASGEDPAYGIMRKAIALAPYYLNNISYYKANVYLKGNLVVKKIPGLIKRSMEREAKKESGSSSGNTMKEGEIYLMESYNEIEFNAPDKYVQKVISFNSTFPEEGNEISPMEYVSASFYQPVIGDMAISPLAPNAFSHYNFKYLGASPQGNYTINKIQVIPKRKSQQLLEGTIYIIDDLWCLQSVDLINENLAGKIRVQQLYIPVQDDIWMPVSHKFEINIEIMGFKADAGYAVSVKYDDVRPNTALQKPRIISSGYTAVNRIPEQVADSTTTKTKKQIDKILEKKELSNRDMVKLSKLMEKETRKSVDDSIRNNLEIKDKTTHIIEKDAGKKDSAYWAEIRPIPLSDLEIRSIRISDSTRSASSLREVKSDTSAANGKKETSKFVTAVKNIGLGHTWSDTSGFSFTYGGLIEPKNLSFNTVDGFVYGFDFRFSKSWKKNKSLTVYPDVKWAFSRKQLMWRINASYRFNGMKQREIFLRTGMTSKDIGNGGGINPLLNNISSLMFENNYLKLYESDYLMLGYGSEIVNGLTLGLTSTYEIRKVLENNTGFSIINTSHEYTDNIPDNSYLTSESDPVHAMRDQNHASVVVKLTYVPYQKYRIDKGIKTPAGSEWPTFSLTWEHGINDFGNTGVQVSHYDMIKGEVFKRHEIGAFSQFRWRVRAGGFLDNRELTFYDFFHFNPQPIPLLINDYEDGFMIPSYYSTSTPEAFGEVHMKYTTPYLLLKFIPGLSNTLMRENILFNCLGSRYHPNYTELGYSLSEIFFLAEVGIYVGFEDLRYKSVGGKLIIKFN